MPAQPDYDFLCKLEKWSKKDAALILCGHDPVDHKDVRFAQNNVPEGLEKSHKLYRIFGSVNFLAKYGKDHYPLDYMLECKKKGVVIPEPLLVAARRLFVHIRKFEKIENQIDEEASATSIGVRERNYLLKIIGAFTSIYFVEKMKSFKSPLPKLSVSSIVEDILQYLEDHNLQSPGLGKSNLHKKISEGIAIFNEDLQD